jgi:hypothetical protein
MAAPTPTREDESDRGSPAGARPGGWSDRLALGAFAAVIVFGLASYLWMGRHLWFGIDEWDFLAARSVSHPSTLFQPHNEHWSTLPILVFRFLYQTLGMRSYRPYLLVAVVTHLTVAVLLWVVMVRARVRPWLATAAGSLFVLFGSGYENILWAFQIGFMGAVAFGLAQLLLADHDGPWARRDWWALAAGLASLMCSGVGVTMVVVVGLAVLVRRGWRMAVAQVAPLAGIYLVWYVAYGHQGFHRRSSITSIPGFAIDVLATTFRSLGHLPGMGIVLAVLLVVGLYLAWSPLRRDEWRSRAAAPGALAVGAVVFVVQTGVGRAATGPTFVRQAAAASRYQYVVAALLIPALGVATEGVGRRLGRWWPVLAVILLVGVPGNLTVASDHATAMANVDQVLRVPEIQAAYAPIADQLPPDTQVDPAFAPWVRLGWLRQAARSGRLPAPSPLGPTGRATLDLSLALQLLGPGSPGSDAGSTCQAVPASRTVRLPAGAEIRLDPNVSASVSDVAGGGTVSNPRILGTPGQVQIYRLGAPMTLQIVPRAPTGVRLCRPPAPK